MGAIKKNSELRPCAPVALTKSHILDDFDCGVPTLNKWLKGKYLKNEVEGASRTYVACVNNHVIAYYAIATGSVYHEDVSGSIKRNMPNPIPIMILGRLAVDLRWQKKGLGSDMLADALKRTLQAADIVGTRAFLVHALSDDAKRFYMQHGFKLSPTDDMDLIISLKEVRKSLVL